MGRLLQAADGSRYLPLFRLLLHSGLRRGEALALRWSNVDLERRVLHVRRTLTRLGGELVTTPPKSERSRRAVPLNDATAAVLEEQRRRQRRERVAAGSRWQRSGLVFATEHGTETDPRDAARALTAAATAAGLDGVGLHTLRHTAASLMLGRGVPMNTVSRMLGHGSIAVTVDLYGHVSPIIARAAADVLGEALQGL